MILEIADITIRPDEQAAFDTAIARGIQSVISKAAGFRRASVHKGIESPERYALQIEWETLENHTVDFRGSAAFAEELKDRGVTVTALCPGITATHMLSNATAANRRLAKLPGILIGDAERVADEGYRACMQGEVIRVPGAVNQAVTLASRATPKWLLRRVVATLARGVNSDEVKLNR